MIYDIQLIIKIYFYLHYFHGIYVALSFLRFIISKTYDIGYYLIQLFKKNENPQILDIQYNIDEIEDEYLLIK